MIFYLTKIKINRVSILYIKTINSNTLFTFQIEKLKIKLFPQIKKNHFISKNIKN